MVEGSEVDFEALLLKEQRNPNAAILQFFLSKYDAEDVVVFVEGNDDVEFYYDFVVECLPNSSLMFFPCEGKSSLLNLKGFLKEYDLRPAPKKMLFFADKDFDDFLDRKPDGVFQTEYYSIENYFCSAEFFEYVLRKFSAGKIRNSSISSLVRSFEELLKQAARNMAAPMAVLCVLKDQNLDLDLDLLSCRDMLEVCNVRNTLRRKPMRVAKFKKLNLPADSIIDIKKARALGRVFAKLEFNRWLRGKYALQIMRMVLRIIEVQNPGLSVHLRKLSKYFGSECISRGKAFLGVLPGLEGYCVD